MYHLSVCNLRTRHCLGNIAFCCKMSSCDVSVQFSSSFVNELIVGIRNLETNNSEVTVERAIKYCSIIRLPKNGHGMHGSMEQKKQNI